tara:strand:+ start:883 stop:1029 length:147 start_codon:yes stop_codon:yes gene_type:complete
VGWIKKANTFHANIYIGLFARWSEIGAKNGSKFATPQVNLISWDLKKT